MTDMTASNLAQILDSLRTVNAHINWSDLWEDEEQFEQFQDSLDDLIQFSALVSPGTSLQDTQTFVGKLTIAKVQLESMQEQDNEQGFVAIGKALEEDIKDMLERSPMVKSVYAKLKNNPEPISNFISEDVDAAIAEPILFVLSALPLIVEDECCEDDEECEDFE